MVWWGARWGPCRSRALGQVLSPKGHPVCPSTLEQMSSPIGWWFLPIRGVLGMVPPVPSDLHRWPCLDTVVTRRGSELLLSAPPKDAQRPRGPLGLDTPCVTEQERWASVPSGCRSRWRSRRCRETVTHGRVTQRRAGWVLQLEIETSCPSSHPGSLSPTSAKNEK